MASSFPPKKNTEFKLFFSLYKNDGTIIANPGTYTKKVSIDGGAVADIAASITEEDTTYGQLSVVLAASEMNGDAIWIYIADDTSGCVPFTATLYTVSSLWDDVQGDLTSIESKIDDTFDDVGDVKTAVETTIPASLTTISGYIDTEVAAILADTNELQTDWANGGRLDLLIDGIKSQTDLLPEDPADQSSLTASIAAIPAAVWNYLVTALTTTGSIGKRLADWLTVAPSSATAYGATDLEICNNALVLLGNNPLADLTDTTKKAVKIVTQFYTQAIEEVIRAYSWNCATTRDTLTVDDDAPEFEWDYRFALPSDCLRVLMVYDKETKFKIENGYILTNDSSGKVQYLKLISVADMDALCRAALSARLASMIAFPLTNSVSVAEAMWKLYQERLDEARTVDASEGSSEQMLNDDWLNARR
jgi:hypothetical protein